ncbi:MAG: hypothetical protein E2O84_07355, partial [Bacteroidetes bacterium]
MKACPQTMYSGARLSKDRLGSPCLVPDTSTGGNFFNSLSRLLPVAIALMVTAVALAFVVLPAGASIQDAAIANPE